MNPIPDPPADTVRELAQKRWNRDMFIVGAVRQLSELFVTPSWDELDPVCQMYLREARADLETGAVVDFHVTVA